MAWCNVWVALALPVLSASGAPHEDAVLLVQHRLPSEEWLPSQDLVRSEDRSPKEDRSSSEDSKPKSKLEPDVQYLIASLLGALHFELAISQRLLRTAAFEAETEATPVPVQQGECSWAELSRARATIQAFNKSLDFHLPKECPKSKAALMPKLRVCMEKLFNVAPRCAYCYEELAAGLPDCYPACAPAVFSCPSKSSENVSVACFSTITGCMRCATPLYLKNMNCTGGHPKETFDVINKIVAAVEVNASRTGHMDDFLKGAAQLLF